MGDFVSRPEIDRIQEHYKKYISNGGSWQKTDNPSWYINRLLRYIEIKEMLMSDKDEAEDQIRLLEAENDEMRELLRSVLRGEDILTDHKWMKRAKKVTELE